MVNCSLLLLGMNCFKRPLNRTFSFQHVSRCLNCLSRVFVQAKSQDSHYQLDSSKVNRRGIYKDLVGSSQAHADYQLRPNFLVTMNVVGFVWEFLIHVAGFCQIVF